MVADASSFIWSAFLHNARSFTLETAQTPSSFPPQGESQQMGQSNLQPDEYDLCSNGTSASYVQTVTDAPFWLYFPPLN